MKSRRSITTLSSFTCSPSKLLLLLLFLVLHAHSSPVPRTPLKNSVTSTAPPPPTAVTVGIDDDTDIDNGAQTDDIPSHFSSLSSSPSLHRTKPGDENESEGHGHDPFSSSENATLTMPHDIAPMRLLFQTVHRVLNNLHSDGMLTSSSEADDDVDNVHSLTTATTTTTTTATSTIPKNTDMPHYDVDTYFGRHDNTHHREHDNNSSDVTTATTTSTKMSHPGWNQTLTHDNDNDNDDNEERRRRKSFIKGLNQSLTILTPLLAPTSQLFKSMGHLLDRALSDTRTWISRLSKTQLSSNDDLDGEDNEVGSQNQDDEENYNMNTNMTMDMMNRQEGINSTKPSLSSSQKRNVTTDSSSMSTPTARHHSMIKQSNTHPYSFAHPYPSPSSSSSSSARPSRWKARKERKVPIGFKPDGNVRIVSRNATTIIVRIDTDLPPFGKSKPISSSSSQAKKVKLKTDNDKLITNFYSSKLADEKQKQPQQATDPEGLDGGGDGYDNDHNTMDMYMHDEHNDGDNNKGAKRPTLVVSANLIHDAVWVHVDHGNGLVAHHRIDLLQPDSMNGRHINEVSALHRAFASSSSTSSSSSSSSSASKMDMDSDVNGNGNHDAIDTKRVVVDSFDSRGYSLVLPRKIYASAVAAAGREEDDERFLFAQLECQRRFGSSGIRRMLCTCDELHNVAIALSNLSSSSNNTSSTSTSTMITDALKRQASFSTAKRRLLCKARVADRVIRTAYRVGAPHVAMRVRAHSVECRQRHEHSGIDEAEQCLIEVLESVAGEHSSFHQAHGRGILTTTTGFDIDRAITQSARSEQKEKAERYDDVGRLEKTLSWADDDDDADGLNNYNNSNDKANGKGDNNGEQSGGKSARDRVMKERMSIIRMIQMIHPWHWGRHQEIARQGMNQRRDVKQEGVETGGGGGGGSLMWIARAVMLMAYLTAVVLLVLCVVDLAWQMRLRWAGRRHRWGTGAGANGKKKKKKNSPSTCNAKGGGDGGNAANKGKDGGGAGSGKDGSAKQERQQVSSRSRAAKGGDKGRGGGGKKKRGGEGRSKSKATVQGGGGGDEAAGVVTRMRRTAGRLWWRL